MSAKLATLALAVALAGAAPARSVPESAALATACEGRDGWSDAAPPARIYGNTYYVGTCGITALLIATPRGHILIDGATAEAAPGIARNIEALGFRLRDVRTLLASHEHFDHVGGLAELARRTGARLTVIAAARRSMESGEPDSADPQGGAITPFKGVRADRVIEDGGRVERGGVTLTAIATPGHSPGGTSWTWRSCEGRDCRTIVYADSLSAVSADGYRFGKHPERVAALRSSIDRIARLAACDILLTPHPQASSLFERLRGKTALIDRGGCARYAATATQRLDARLASEAAR